MKQKSSFFLFIFILAFGIVFRGFADFNQNSLFNIISSVEGSSDSYVKIIVEVEGDPNQIGTEVANLYSEKHLSVQNNVKYNIQSETNSIPNYTYTETFKGFSIDAKKEDIEKIKEMPNVKKVYRVRRYEPMAISDQEEIIHLPAISNLGYDGEGMAVAVIDNSFNVNRSSFTLSNPDKVKLNKENIASILSNQNLNAKSFFSSVTADSVYKSSKIPFAFDYGDKDANTYVEIDSHGTRTASVAAGNGTILPGIAKEAQLVLMKAMSTDGYIYEDALLAAFDDAVKIGVDAVNISLGSDSGFTDTGDDYLDFNEPFGIARSSGITVAVAVGNSNRLNEFGMGGINSATPLAKNTDYGLIASPATSYNAIGVGSFYSESQNPKISSTSAWGPTPDLKLKPDIVALGHITSSTQTNYSGTSYASPMIAGSSVLIKQYIKQTYPNLSDIDTIDLVEQLMMSTADVIAYNNIPYSPRKQGSGLLNLEKVINSKVILYGNDKKTKLVLNDQLNQTFSMSFIAKNLSSTDYRFTPDAIVITDSCNSTTKKVSVNSQLFSTSSVVFSETEILVPANSEKEITVTITLSDQEITQQLQYFENGFYVEGFLKLTSLSNQTSNLNIPFMGYYQDWLDAPIFVTNDYLYPFGLCDSNGYLGGNCFLDEINYDKNKIAFSPNGDKERDSFGIFMSLFRNAKDFQIKIKDSNQNIVKAMSDNYVAKTQQNYYYNMKYLWWDGSNSVGEALPEGTYTYEATATVDYPNSEDKAQTLSLPVVIDTTAPTLLNAQIVKAEDKKYLEFQVADNLYMQAAQLFITNAKTPLITCAFTDSLENEIITVRFDITAAQATDYTLKLFDYAYNSISVNIKPCTVYVAYYNDSNKVVKVKKEEALLLDGESTYLVDQSELQNYSYAVIYIWDENYSPLLNPQKITKN